MIEVNLNYKPLVAGILKAPAALPPHRAERLCLSGILPIFLMRLCLKSKA